MVGTPETHRRLTGVSSIRIEGTPVSLRGGPGDGRVRSAEIGGQSLRSQWLEPVGVHQRLEAQRGRFL